MLTVKSKFDHEILFSRSLKTYITSHRFPVRLIAFLISRFYLVNKALSIFINENYDNITTKTIWSQG